MEGLILFKVGTALVQYLYSNTAACLSRRCGAGAGAADDILVLLHSLVLNNYRQILIYDLTSSRLLTLTLTLTWFGSQQTQLHTRL